MDKFYRGFTAGVLAAIALNAWSLFSFYVIQLTDLRMLDWAGIAIFGSIPQTGFQVVSSLLMQLIWSGFRGILFSYLFPDVKSQGYIGKAVIFSVIVAFFENIIVTLYKVPNLTELTSGTVLSSNIGAILWGILLGFLVRRLDGTQEKQEAG